jgi:hypothetical protein
MTEKGELSSSFFFLDINFFIGQDELTTTADDPKCCQLGLLVLSPGALSQYVHIHTGATT